MKDSSPGQLIGLIGDVHGNPNALSAVLEELQRRGVDSVRALGDWVGYSVGVREAVDTLQEEEIPSVAGNHDLMISGAQLGTPSEVARKSLEIGSAMLSERHLRLLSSLPARIDEEWHIGRALMVHGTPDQPLEGYLRATDVLTTSLPSGVAVVVTGATHRPLLAKQGDTLIINPGSVGIPRDGDPRAGFAIVDTSTGNVELLRLAYDPTTIAVRNKTAGIPDVVNEHLFLGRPAPEPIALDARRYSAFSSSIDRFGSDRVTTRTGAGFYCLVEAGEASALMLAVVLDGSYRVLLRSSPLAESPSDRTPSDARWIATPDGTVLERVTAQPVTGLGEDGLVGYYEEFEQTLKEALGEERDT